MVEFPRNYALEIYVGNPNMQKVSCRLRTDRQTSPTYDQEMIIEKEGVRVIYYLHSYYSYYYYSFTVDPFIIIIIIMYLVISVYA